MSAQTPDTPDEDAPTDAESDATTPESEQKPVSTPIRTHPTIRPTLIWLGVVAVLGGGVIAAIWTNTDLVGGPDVANVVIQAVGLLTLLGVLRFMTRVYVLRQTKYVVDEDTISRQYELFFRTWRRTVPVSKVRSHELRQSRVQKLLGYGTISLNQGLGAIELENVTSPHSLYDDVSTLVEQ
ncbi:PH domain-containing protein [Halorussus salilacus]|uniref:PH domain-containing protein n=1 Tax=Halorussus salilacus TaxID=2953750 RepID=UPI00209F79E0|nr:PH domain-containing protein [Halorussus salilacus]USZ69516.1 PH domain-containing protein [Halorussus salilacus]